MLRKLNVILLLISLSFLGSNPLCAADDIVAILTGKKPNEKTEIIPQTITTNNTKQDDKKIYARLNSIFKEINTLRNITIAVNNGIVTLNGEVDSKATQTKALQLARQVQGVVEVQDELSINLNLETRLETTRQKILISITKLVATLPLVLLAVLVLMVFWLLGKWLSKQQKLYTFLNNNYFIASLMGQFVYLVFIISGGILALSLLDATNLISAILGAAGIVGLAIGFAVRDTVENYIASILLSLRNPFNINDLVKIELYEGRVVALTSRATMLIALDGTHIRIPNAIVFKSIITNFSRNTTRRFQFDIMVDSKQDILKVQALALQVLKQVDGVLAEPKLSIIIQEWSDNGLMIRIWAWVDQTQVNFAKVRSEAMRQVKQVLEQAQMLRVDTIYKIQLVEQSEMAPVQQSTTASDESAVKDISADQTVEHQVLQAQHGMQENNLLNPQAPQEL